MLHAIIILSLIFVAFEGYKYKRKVEKENKRTREEAINADLDSLFSELKKAYEMEFPDFKKDEIFARSMETLKQVAKTKTGEAQKNALKAIEVITNYRNKGVLSDYQIENFAILANLYATK